MVAAKTSRHHARPCSRGWPLGAEQRGDAAPMARAGRRRRWWWLIRCAPPAEPREKAPSFGYPRSATGSTERGAVGVVPRRGRRGRGGPAERPRPLRGWRRHRLSRCGVVRPSTVVLVLPTVCAFLATEPGAAIHPIPLDAKAAGRCRHLPGSAARRLAASGSRRILRVGHLQAPGRRSAAPGRPRRRVQMDPDEHGVQIRRGSSSTGCPLRKRLARGAAQAPRYEREVQTLRPTEHPMPSSSAARGNVSGAGSRRPTEQHGRQGPEHQAADKHEHVARARPAGQGEQGAEPRARQCADRSATR